MGPVALVVALAIVGADAKVTELVKAVVTLAIAVVAIAVVVAGAITGATEVAMPGVVEVVGVAIMSAV